jgi:hypothetical protein
MKLGKTSLSGTSLVLLAVQLALVSSIAAKVLYQRWSCPRVWTRAVAYDPEMVMRGRYLSLQLMVDGCQSTLPSAAEAEMPRNKDGVPTGKFYSIRANQFVQFPAQLKVVDKKLLAIRLAESDESPHGVSVGAAPGTSCEDLHVLEPVDFYIAEKATSPTPVKPGQELWIEVTVPPQGPPRPIQLALKDGEAWRPLAFE